MFTAKLHFAPSFTAGTRHIFQRQTAAPRLPRAHPKVLTRTMAAQQSTNLDKSTPESVWKEVLGTEEYRILRQKGTEPAGTGEYNKNKADGMYRCAGCGAELYNAATKFDSGCGWPAFYAEVPGAVDRHTDITMGMARTEITCAKCGGHLGHVFMNEGFRTPTDARHCVNSRSLKFQAK